jgi:hypothetical protein
MLLAWTKKSTMQKPD